MTYCHHCPERRVIVEPLVFQVLFCMSLLDQVTQQYVFNKYNTKTEPIPHNVRNLRTMVNTCNISQTSGFFFIGENTLRSEPGKWGLYLKLAAAVPSLFTLMVLGVWSDQAGRRIALFLSSCGSLIQVSVHLLVVNLELPICVLLIGNVAYGITGYVTLVITVCMAYTADVTSKEQRTIQIVLLSAVIGIGIDLAKFISHYWMDTSGLEPPLWLIFGCNIANIIYIQFFIPETIVRENRSINFSSWKIYILNICRFISSDMCRSIWCQLMTIYLVIIFIVEAVQAGCYDLMLTYSINWPLCFDEVYIRCWYGGVTCTYITGLIAVKLLQQFLPWLNDHWIIQFGLLSAIGGFALAAFAKTVLVMFLVVGMLAQIPLAVLSSSMSKIVDFRQQGLIFALIGCIASIAWGVGYLIFQSLYHATKHILTGMPFLLGAGVLIIVMTLFKIMHFYQGRRSYNIFVESITSQGEGSTSESEESETVTILGQNQIHGNHSYQTL